VLATAVVNSVAVILKGAVMFKEVTLVVLTTGRPGGTMMFKEVTLEPTVTLKIR
jgi:hypothetical protein